MRSRSLRLHLDPIANPAISLRRAGRLVSVEAATSVRDLLGFYRNPGVMWRGFRHQWRYNHRLNRFGSWIKDLRRSDDGTGSAKVGHAGASGSGPDTLHYRDGYAEVRATGVFFKSGSESFTVSGSEGEDEPIQREVVVHLTGPLRSCKTFAVLLAGVDLCAARDADKLQSLLLAVGDWERRGDRLTFKLTGTLNVDCDSLECDGVPGTWDLVAAVLSQGGSIPVSVGRMLLAKLNLATEYDLDVHYLIIGGSDRTLNVVPADGVGAPGWVENHYNWDTIDEIDLGVDGTEPVRFDDVWHAGRSTSVLGLGTLATVIEEGEPHMLEWDLGVSLLRARDRMVEGEVELFFKNWTQGMRNTNVASLASFRAGGKVRLGVGVTLVQFREVDFMREGTHSGSLHWAALRHDSSCIQAAVESGHVSVS